MGDDGKLVKGYEYDEYGNTTDGGEESFINEVTFTGSVRDLGSGLQYMNARYYDPATGRFVSQDTYTGTPYAPWTQHLYSYCGNNPVNMVDPTGHMPIKPIAVCDGGTTRVVPEPSGSEENVSWWNKAVNWVSNAASDAWEWVKNAAIDVGDFVVDTIDSISNYFEENPEVANIAKGLGVIALAGVVVLATGGTGAGVVGVIATKAFQGAVLGSVTGGTVGMGVEVIKDRIETGSWDGWMEAAYRGGAQGFGDGSTTGFIAGGFSSMIGVMRSNRIMSKTTGMCFVAGTEVHTEEGKERIEEIEAGDRVWAEDPETGEKGIKTVVRTFERETDELVRVYAGGEEIITTAEHPFYVPKRGWTAAIELRAGDVLVNVNGEYVILEKIEHELLESPVKVYNFEVEDFHTYYVGDSGVLVHNMCKLNNVFNSIKEAPNYDSRFIKDNLRKVNVKNEELLNELNQFGRGWKKVYNNGYIEGQKVSMHYFQNKAGKIFDLWIKDGWS